MERDPDLNIPSVVTASVVSPGRIFLLDRRFTLQAARWPEIYAALMHRLIVRSRRLSLQSAMNAGLIGGMRLVPTTRPRSAIRRSSPIPSGSVSRSPSSSSRSYSPG